MMVAMTKNKKTEDSKVEESTSVKRGAKVRLRVLDTVFSLYYH